MSGNVAFEIVLLMPVLVLLTLFVVWAGRGGQVRLDADLAAEEAATAAALCCGDDDDESEAQRRESIAQGVIDSNPNLNFLCIGGVRPTAGPGGDELVYEHWADFDPGLGSLLPPRDADALTTGIGIVDVGFSCETDGAVAPLRGLFPTVRFDARAAEVVPRPRLGNGVGFDPTETLVTEGMSLEFGIVVGDPQESDLDVFYCVVPVDQTPGTWPASTAESPDDYDGDSFAGDPCDLADSGLEATATIPAGETQVDVSLDTVDDRVYEAPSERLVLVIERLGDLTLPIDPARQTFIGTIEEALPQPRIQVECLPGRGASEEGGALEYKVRLYSPEGDKPVPPADDVTVRVTAAGTGTSPATAGIDFVAQPYADEDLTTPLPDGEITFTSERTEIPVWVRVLDDEANPVAEADEHVALEFELIDAPSYVEILDQSTTCANGTDGAIYDDEAELVISAASALEGDPLEFELRLRERGNGTLPDTDVVVNYELKEVVQLLGLPPKALLGDQCADPAMSTSPDFVRWEDSDNPGTYAATGSVTFRQPSATDGETVKTVSVTTCDEMLVEFDEQMWLDVEVANGEAIVSATNADGLGGHGARGTITNDDIPTISTDELERLDDPDDVSDPFTASFDSGSAAEGETLEMGVALVVDGQPAQLARNISFDYEFVSASPTVGPSPQDGVCQAGEDFDISAPDATQGRVTISAGTADPAKTFSLPLCDDYLLEDAETLRLVFSDADISGLFGQFIDGTNRTSLQLQGTIVDDPPPMVEVTGFSGVEGTTQEFVVALTDPRAGETATVTYTIGGDTDAQSKDRAMPPGSRYPDFSIPAPGALSGTLSFPPGTTEQRMPVELLSDGLHESDEHLRIDIQSAQRAYLSGDEHARGTIIDEPSPYISVDSPDAREGDLLTFTVTLHDAVSNSAATFDYAVQERSAIPGADYLAPGTPVRAGVDCVTASAPQPLSGTFTLSDLNGTATVRVQTCLDSVDESPETLVLELSNLRGNTQNAVFDPAIGTGTIRNTEVPIVRISDDEKPEGEALKFDIRFEDNDGNLYVNPGQSGLRTRAIVDVNFATRDVTATAGPRFWADVAADYESTSRPLRFEPSQSATQQVEVATYEDVRPEFDETVEAVISLDAGSVASIGDGIGTGTIVDRSLPELRIQDASGSEGQTIFFQVDLVEQGTRNPITWSEDIVFEVSPVDGTATYTDEPTSDFSGNFGQKTLRAGESRFLFPVELRDDGAGVIENTEEFWVLISQPTNAVVGKSAAKGTILGQCIDPFAPGALAPALNLAPQQFVEGSSYGFSFFFQNPICPGRDITINMVQRGWPEVGISDRHPHPARCFEDLNCQTRGFTISAGSTGQPVSLAGFGQERDDLEDEFDETFEVWAIFDPDASHQFAGRLAGATIYTILDNDPEPRVRILDAYADPGEDMVFKLQYSRSSGRETGMSYRTVDLTASGSGDDADFTGVSEWTPIVFPEPGRPEIPGSQADFDPEIRIPTAPNDSLTASKTFRIELAGASFVQFEKAIAYGTIRAAGSPLLRVEPASAAEGDPLVFDITLDRPAPRGGISFDIETVELSESALGATEDSDYEATQSRLTIPAGETATTFQVDTLTDAADETDEVLLVEMSNQTPGVVFARRTAIGTIEGDLRCYNENRETLSEYPTLHIDGATSLESQSQTTYAVSVDIPFCRNNQVWFEFSDGSIDPGGTATINGRTASGAYRSCDAGSNADLTCTIDRRVRFSAGQTTGSMQGAAYRIVDDLIAEDDETYVLVWDLGDLWQVSRACDDDPECSSEQFVATTSYIIDDDKSVFFAPAQVIVEEGDVAGLDLSISVQLDRDFAIEYEIGELPQPEARAGRDFRAVTGTHRFLEQAVRSTLSVQTIDDDLDEGEESLLVRFGDYTPDWVEWAPEFETVEVIIVDDDPPPSISIADARANEAQQLAFELQLSKPSGRDTAVTYQTRADSATAGADFTAITAGRVDIPEGDTSAVILIDALADDVTERDEHFFVDLAVPEDGFLLLGDATAQGTILDSSDRPLRVADAITTEGGVLKFEVSFAGLPRAEDITVQYRTVADTATANADYADAHETQAGEARILAGRRSATVSVQTVDDRIDEAAERMSLQLSSPVGATLVDPRAVGVIIDNDPAPTVRVSDAESAEDDAEGTMDFQVRLSEASGRKVTLRASTEDGTASEPGDYTALDAFEFEIAPGTTDATVSVPLVDDEVAEPVENFRLRLAGATNALIDDGVALGRILDDDGLPDLLAVDPAAVSEAAGAQVDFVVRLSRAATTAVTVDYATQAGSAQAGTDYVATSGSLSFAVGDTRKTVTVDLVDDAVVEPVESFDLRLSNAAGANIGDDTATAEVLDDDGLPTLSIADASVGEAAGVSAQFVVTLSEASPRPVTVEYSAVADLLAGPNQATPAVDFTAVSGTLTVPARTTQATIEVPVLDDAVDESDETFWVRLSDAAGATATRATAVGTIVDNEPLPQIRIADAEGDEGTALRFELTLDLPSERIVQVLWNTQTIADVDLRATPGADFRAASGVAEFALGSTKAFVEVETIQDNTQEADERFAVHLGQPTNALNDDSIASGQILDDDGLLRVAISDVTVLESESPAVVPVKLNRPSSQPVTVGYTTSDGTASAGTSLADPGDYLPDAPADRTLTIAAGQVAGEISIFIADDGETEGAETFDVSLVDPSTGVTIADDGTATVTILDDSLSTVSVGDATATESDGSIEFEVTLNRALGEDLTLRYRTFDGTATQPNDYIAAVGTVVIAAGDTTETFSVSLADDTFHEEAESMLVRISTDADVNIVRGEAAGVILDDDGLPRLAGGPNLEVNEDVGSVTLEVTLDRPSDQRVTVEYATARNLAVGDGCPTIDHVSGTLVFEPGATEQTVDVNINHVDEVCQGFENVGTSFNHDFILRLANPSNAVFAPGSRSVNLRIWDIEQLPYVRFESVPFVSVLEDEGSVEFRLRLNRLSSQDVVVTYRTDRATFRSSSRFTALATAGTDYTAITSGTATITAGSIDTTETVTIADDAIAEPTEGFVVRVVSATGAQVYLPFGGLIRDILIFDDDGLAISAHDTTVAESAGSAQVRVALNSPASSEVTVAYATQDSTAVQPSDYQSTSGTLRFAPGVTEMFVAVPLVDDDTAEPDETFTLSLSSPSGATVADSDATVTITGDTSDLPVVSISDVTVFESEDRMWFEATLDEASALAVTVTWAHVEVPSLGVEAAAEISDYRMWSEAFAYTLTIPAGATSATTYVLIEDDDIPEHDERLLLVLRDPTNATLGKQQAWGTIIDDDRPIAQIGDVTADENAGTMTFTVTLHAAGVIDGSLRYATDVRASSSAGATPGQDYRAASGELNFPAGTTVQTFTVPIVNDSDDEPDESFLIRLSGASFIALGDPLAVATIEDDDPGWTVDDVRVRESAGQMIFTVTRDHTSAAAVTLTYEIAADGGSATAGTACGGGVDYTAPVVDDRGTVELQPADTSATITVTICEDTTTESRETLVIELISVTGRKLTGTGTIVDND